MTRHRLIATTAIALGALALPSAASASDRDHDKMRDSWEKHYKLNPRKNDARKDKDRDGLKNLSEYRAGTNPRKKDSDDDRVRDDREGAGTIKSFDPQTGVLVIDLFESDEDLTGKVDSSTEIECEDDRIEREDEHGDDDGQHGDDDGERGDDDGEHGDDDGKDDDDRKSRDDGEDGDEDEDEPEESCNADWLDAGRTVKEAELHDGSDVFEEIEIVK